MQDENKSDNTDSDKNLDSKGSGMNGPVKSECCQTNPNRKDGDLNKNEVEWQDWPTRFREVK